MSDIERPSPDTDETSESSWTADTRIYATDPESWTAAIKQGWERERCYAKRPGEDFFHLIMNGEIHLVRGHEKYCLECALRNELVTRDRLHWQNAERTIPLAD